MSDSTVAAGYIRDGLVDVARAINRLAAAAEKRNELLAGPKTCMFRRCEEEPLAGKDWCHGHRPGA